LQLLFVRNRDGVATVNGESDRGIEQNDPRRISHSTEKARLQLRWQPRSTSNTLIDCANGLITHKVV